MQGLIKIFCSFFINIALVVFNMIPAFPMDGGRVFRALLSHFLKSRLKATFIASVVGQILAVAFLFAGKYFEHYMLMVIGVFGMHVGFGILIAVYRMINKLS